MVDFITKTIINTVDIEENALSIFVFDCHRKANQAI